MKIGVEGLIEIKLRTAMRFAKGKYRDEGGQSHFKSTLDGKAVQAIGLVVDSKQYGQWSKKMKNALNQIRPN